LRVFDRSADALFFLIFRILFDLARDECGTPSVGFSVSLKEPHGLSLRSLFILILISLVLHYYASENSLRIQGSGRRHDRRRASGHD
jgi:hypothetical protein